MAYGLPCDRDECKESANWMLTSLDPPFTTNTCDDDFPVFVIYLLARSLGVDESKLYDHVQKFVNRAAAAEAKAKGANGDGQPADPADPATVPEGTAGATP